MFQIDVSAVEYV